MTSKRAALWSLSIAMFLPSANAQCGRCGDGGGTGGTSDRVIATRFLSTTPVSLSNGRLIRASVKATAQTVRQKTTTAAQASLVFEGFTAAPRVTVLELWDVAQASAPVRVVNFQAGSAPAQADPTAAFVLQAPSETAIRANAYTYELRFTLDGVAYVLPVAPAQSEFLAMAWLRPLPATGTQLPSVDAGVGVFSATFARDLNNKEAAEFRFEAVMRPNGFDVPALRGLSAHTGMRKQGDPVPDAGGLKANVPAAGLQQSKLQFTRLVDNVNNSQVIENLQLLVQSPENYLLDFEGRTATQQFGGFLQRPEVLRLRLLDAEAFAATVDGVAALHVLRSKTGNVLGGFAEFDILYRGLTADSDPASARSKVSNLVPYDSSGNAAENSLATLDAATNDLAVRNSTGAVSLRTPLLADSGLLLLIQDEDAPFSGVLRGSDNATPLGSFISSPLAAVTASAVPTIRTVTPAVTTPGSIITLSGSGYNAGGATGSKPAVYIDGLLADDVRSVSSDGSTLVVRVPVEAKIDLRARPAPVFVSVAGRPSAIWNMVVDAAEPYLYTDIAGFAKVTDSLTRAPMTKTNPIKAGRRVEIACTGFYQSFKSSKGAITVDVRIGGVAAKDAAFEQSKTSPGEWTVTFTAPDLSGLDGVVSKLAVVTANVPSDSATSPTAFPSNAVSVWVSN